MTQPPGNVRANAAALVLVPIVSTGVAHDHLRQLGIDLAVVFVMRFAPYFDGIGFLLDQFAQSLHDVAGLTFRIEYGAAAVAAVGVRAVHYEEVGKRRYGYAKVCTRIMIPPVIADTAARPDDIHWIQR